ncbi:hypothetical protein BC941DRAFT_510994 [Chlamydoabsidia padenii]|nr:hypothetical protein BC941DRAFT_510994 [Chlamydoabsidia padenii]
MSLQNDLELIYLRESYMKNSNSNTTMLSCVESNSSSKSVDLHRDDDLTSKTGSLPWSIKQWFSGKSLQGDDTNCSSIRKSTCQLSKPNDKLNRLVTWCDETSQVLEVEHCQLYQENENTIKQNMVEFNSFDDTNLTQLLDQVEAEHQQYIEDEEHDEQELVLETLTSRNELQQMPHHRLQQIANDLSMTRFNQVRMEQDQDSNTLRYYCADYGYVTREQQQQCLPTSMSSLPILRPSSTHCLVCGTNIIRIYFYIC